LAYVKVSFRQSHLQIVASFAVQHREHFFWRNFAGKHCERRSRPIAMKVGRSFRQSFGKRLAKPLKNVRQPNINIGPSFFVGRGAGLGKIVGCVIQSARIVGGDAAITERVGIYRS
jgi:hypothetical protein